jgi:integrase
MRRAKLYVICLSNALDAALCASRSAWVFPGTDGKMRTPSFAPENLLRAAMRRANLVDGWRHICRRKTCRFELEATDPEIRDCPKCDMRLWPSPKLREIRFHSLRHTTASLLLMANADLQAVQRIMGQQPARDERDLRPPLERLPARAGEQAPTRRRGHRSHPKRRGFCYPVATQPRRATPKTLPAGGKISTIPTAYFSEEYGT